MKHVPAAERTRLEAVAASHAMVKRGDPRLEEIVRAAVQQYRTAYAAISIITYHRQLLLARVGLTLGEMARAESFCATAIQRPGEPLVVPDARQDRRFADFLSVTGEAQIRFYAGVPLVNHAGYAVGALCVADPSPAETPVDVLPLTMLGLRAEAILSA